MKVQSSVQLLFLLMSFADLRKARNARQAALLIKTTAPTPAKSSLSPQEPELVLQSEAGPQETSAPYAVDAGLYPTLGPSFEIRTDSSMGRGIYVKRGLSTAVKAGECMSTLHQ